MTIALLVLALGLILFFIPQAPPNNWRSDKPNTLGLVLIVLGAFFAMAAYGGKTVRVGMDAVQENQQAAVDCPRALPARPTYELTGRWR